mmetsp:Transcript_26829/g.43819  ORF Transcript_26829/g.43819 Transcript_26829/m.43819 type:complete len:365 (+) Transcript_26829:51-1145(+)|eukprot:CAMPEP_0184643236 /NCGR_PEP_ID=MMETSP0308-20130426/41_1 /TAXON_ID=38269 /ORGANISM="Gloeochaete witrockiana, Strain SAG 46.84" /LENGTH=364 /DNA_ID=CAMNT_0027071015 /DNA_START=16 /DNA_END=1110 /DNA_ORIENTATION=-
MENDRDLRKRKADGTEGPDDAKRSKEEGNQCYRCGGSGHFAKECSSTPGAANDSAASVCFKCKGKGHFARDCPNIRRDVCFYCQDLGHHGMDCPRNPNRKGGSVAGTFMKQPLGNFVPVGRGMAPGFGGPLGGGGSGYSGMGSNGYGSQFGNSPDVVNQLLQGRQAAGGMGQGGYGSQGYGMPQNSGMQSQLGYNGVADMRQSMGGAGGGQAYPGMGGGAGLGYGGMQGGVQGQQGGGFYNPEYSSAGGSMASRDSRGGLVCHKCGEVGHKAFSCPRNQDGGMSNAMPGPPGRAPDACFRCGDSGHFSRDCTKNGAVPARDSCFKCGQSGHKALDCTGPDIRTCFICKQNGHISKECPNRGAAY